MAQQGTIRRLSVAMLGLNKDHTPYSDGVACIQAYWAYAMDLPQGERTMMRRLILEHKYDHTIASRDAFSEHPLCRDSAGTTRPGLILLRALYKAVPVDFQNDVVARCGRLPVRNRSDEYFAISPTIPSMVSPVVMLPIDIGWEEISPSPPPIPIPNTLSQGLPWNEVFGQQAPGLNTALNNNQNVLAHAGALLESMLQQSFDSNESPMQNPCNLMQPPLTTTTGVNRPVTRQEFHRLRTEVATMKSHMATLEENVNMLRRAFERRERRRERRREQRRL
ncbi:hypothetical protein V8C34DRAFT_280097 [Trichoderma compactum]